jgi:hypothetical protein
MSRSTELSILHGCTLYNWQLGEHEACTCRTTHLLKSILKKVSSIPGLKTKEKGILVQ